MRRTRQSKTTAAQILIVVLGLLLVAGPAAANAVNQGDPEQTVEDGAAEIDESLEPAEELWDEIVAFIAKKTPFEDDDFEFPEVSDLVSDDDSTPETAADADDNQDALLSGPSLKAHQPTYGTRSDAQHYQVPSAETSAGLSVPLAYAATIAAGIGLLLIGPLSMYRRVKKSQALDNDVRHSIYKFVENNPGATVTEIAEGVGVSHSTATYHVKILQEFDLIKKRRDGNSLHIFPSDAALDKKEALLLSYMRDRETREIIRSIYANPWTYPSELARSLDMSRSSAQWHLEKLEESGIVNVVRDGKFSYLYIEPEMKDTVEDHLVQ